MTGWHEWRRGGIGASDIGALLNLSPWEKPWGLWARKVGLRPPTEETDAMRRGHDFEGVIGTLFTRDTGLYIAGEQTLCQHPEEPWMRCTVDGFVFDGPTEFVSTAIGDALGGFEAKTDGRFGWPDGVPPAYEAQAKWSMAVTGLDRWFIAVLFAGFRFAVYEIERDPDDEQFMVERARAFWESYVLTGTQPPTDGSDATLDALAEVYPTHIDGEAVELDDVRIKAWGDWTAATSMRKFYDAQVSAAKAELQAFLGDAETGTVDGQRVVSWKTQHRKGYVVEEADIRVMRAHQPKESTPS